jgi:hypothetical protein
MKTAMQQLIEWGDQMISDDPAKTLSFYKAIDKAEELLEVEKRQMMKTWTKAIDQTQERAWNVVRAYDDFDDYYNETYGGDE